MLLVAIPVVTLHIQKKSKDKEYIIKVEEALLANGLYVDKTYVNTDARVAEALRLLLINNELRRHGENNLIKVQEYTGDNSLIQNCIKFTNRSTWREEDQATLYNILDTLEKWRISNELATGFACMIITCAISVDCLIGIISMLKRLRK